MCSEQRQQSKKTVTVIAERPPAAFTLRISAREQTEQPRLLEVLPNNPGTDREFSFFCRQSMHSQTDDLGPMHACLNVDEILRLIVCELVESKAKATAAALACCRKSFEDPALDVLWEAQDGLLPLLKSFPADVWSEGGYTVSTPVAHILSPLTVLFESLSNDTRRRWNGLVSGSTLERSEKSEIWGVYASCLRRFSWPCSFVPSANPCSHT